jgi:CDGSH-type Zn-finger protein
MDQPTRTYENERIAVEWYPERCIHARFRPFCDSSHLIIHFQAP